MEEVVVLAQTGEIAGIRISEDPNCGVNGPQWI